MKTLVLISLLAVCLLQIEAVPRFLRPKNADGKIWALLAAGSNGWENYRHQADVAHSYHLLLNHGVPKENIIVMAYDDIANNSENPFKGAIYNDYAKKINYYEGLQIDYKGADVTPQNWIAILKGQKDAVKGGNGRVIESTANDNVFLYFSDHGAAGLIAFPRDELYVKDFNETLVYLQENKRFNQLVFYLETCESGSMFDGIVQNNTEVLAVSAASPDESSWGTFCEDSAIDTCLGDEFSVNWMSDTEKNDVNSETLAQQFENVKKATNDSHVHKYGDESLLKQSISIVQGSQQPNSSSISGINSVVPSDRVSNYDVQLYMLERKFRRENDAKKRVELAEKIRSIKEKRKYLEDFMSNLAEKVANDQNEAQKMIANHPGKLTKLACHQTVVEAFSRDCFNFSQNSYALKFVYVLANFCENGISEEHILETLKTECAAVKFQGIV